MAMKKRVKAVDMITKLLFIQNTNKTVFLINKNGIIARIKNKKKTKKIKNGGYLKTLVNFSPYFFQNF